MNDDILKKENPKLYHVAREGGTEPAYTGEYIQTKEDGMYHCAICDTPLFSSEAKFDSGSGWPSFTDPAIADAVKLHDDDRHGMHRTEVRCAKCDAHLGHVFPDGPTKNGESGDRFCINSISLDFKPKKNATEDRNEGKNKREARDVGGSSETPQQTSKEKDGIAETIVETITELWSKL